MKPTFKPPMIGAFEDLGKDIVREVVKAPTDIGEKIVESLTGAGSTKGTHGNKQIGAGAPGEEQKGPDGALGTIDKTNDHGIKKAVARAALAQLATPKTSEPTIFEQKNKDEQQKKEQEKKQQLEMSQRELPKMTSKKRRGDLYGIKGKSSSEKSRNVRQD